MFRKRASPRICNIAPPPPIADPSTTPVADPSTASISNPSASQGDDNAPAESTENTAGPAVTSAPHEKRTTDTLLLDRELAPPPKRLGVCVSDSLPIFLQLSGNRRAWETVVGALRKEHNAAIMIHGPTGCGKTRGIAECARRVLGMSVYELNPAIVRSTEAFTRDIQQVTSTRTLLGSRMVLVDDLDGFDESFIASFVRLLKHRTRADGPLVITCVNPFDRALIGLRPLELTRVRLYAPTEKQMVEAWKSHRKDVPPLLLERHVKQSFGNFHQLAILLRSHCDSRPDAHTDLFETTHRHIMGAANMDDWLRAGEPHILTAILHENYCALTQRGEAATELDRAEAFVDALSDSLVMSNAAALEYVGRSARTFLRTTDPPPLRLTKQLKHGERADLDMPRLLLSSQRA